MCWFLSIAEYYRRSADRQSLWQYPNTCDNPIIGNSHLAGSEKDQCSTLAPLPARLSQHPRGMRILKVNTEVGPRLHRVLQPIRSLYCAIVFMTSCRVTKRGRQTETETERHRHRRKKKRETERQEERKTDSDWDRDRRTQNQRGKRHKGQKTRQTDRDRKKQTQTQRGKRHKETGRETERDRDRDRDRKTHIPKEERDR